MKVNENVKPDVEIKDTTMEDLGEALQAFVGESVKLLESLGKALTKTAQDVSNLMVIKVDGDIRKHLDILVDIGLSDNRRNAAVSLIEEGINVKAADYAKIDQTKAEIAELRKQMQELVPSRS